MPLQTSGTITLLDIQNEFGGSNPIGLSEYYRGGTYVPDNNSANTGIPTSGAISLSSFYGASRTSPLDDILAAYFADEIVVRNYLTSKGGMNFGFEDNTETDLTFGGGNAWNTYSSQIDSTLTFGTVPTELSNIITDYLTVVTINLGGGNSNVLTQPTLVVNSTDYSSSDVSNVYIGNILGLRVKVYHIPVDLQNISTIRAVYNASNGNNHNRQEVYVIPGKWSVITNSYVNQQTSRTVSVQENDIIIANSILNWDNYVPVINATGATANLVMQRGYYWYQNSAVMYEIITETGNRTYTWPSVTYVVSDPDPETSGDETYATVYSDAGILQLRYSES